VIGVNRIGEDGHGVSFSGDSVVIDPRGRKQSRTKAHQENVETITLSYNDLLEFRKKFQVHLDADDFDITRTGRF
jgi:predicted amidohydrolase